MKVIDKRMKPETALKRIKEHVDKEMAILYRQEANCAKSRTPWYETLSSYRLGKYHALKDLENDLYLYFK